MYVPCTIFHLQFVFFWPRLSAYHPPLFFRTKLDEPPLFLRYRMGGSSSLVRSYKGVTAES